MPTFLAPLLHDSSRPFHLEHVRTGRPVATTVLTAFDSASRNTGLLKRDAFPPGSALIIAPTNAIHTFFMRFAIDLLFVAKDGTIVKIRSSVRPWRIAVGLGAYAVIELPAGALAGCDIAPGDRLALARSL